MEKKSGTLALQVKRPGATEFATLNRVDYVEVEPLEHELTRREAKALLIQKRDQWQHNTRYFDGASFRIASIA